MNIQFLSDTSKAKIPDDWQGDDTIMVYREGYALPDVNVAAKIEFAKYKASYPSYMPQNLILVGLNKIVLPSNRCDLVFEYLQENSKSVNKISIDTSPFVGEPWRFWFHFSMTGQNPWRWPHSYFVETMWKHWFERQQDDCDVSAKSIYNEMPDVYTDLKPLSFQPSFYEPSGDLIEQYSVVREQAFATHDTFKSIYGFILKNMPLDEKVSFDMYRNHDTIELPDLKIFRFVADENIRRMDIYNSCIGAYYGNA